MAKWSKAQHAKYAVTCARKRSEAKRAARSTEFNASAHPPVDSHYVGETAQAPAVDINRLEERAFRRGMFTALQMVVDLLIRELR